MSYTELNIANWKQERFYIIKKVFNRTIAIANALKDSAFEEFCFAELCKDHRAQSNFSFCFSWQKKSGNIKCLFLCVNTNYFPYTHSLLMSLSQRKQKTYIDLNCLQQTSTLLYLWKLQMHSIIYVTFLTGQRQNCSQLPVLCAFLPQANNSLNVDRIFVRKIKICPQITHPIISSPSFSKHSWDSCFQFW